MAKSERLEYELVYHDSTVHRINHDTPRTPPGDKGYMPFPRVLAKKESAIADWTRLPWFPQSRTLTITPRVRPDVCVWYKYIYIYIRMRTHAYTDASILMRPPTHSHFITRSHIHLYALTFSFTNVHTYACMHTRCPPYAPIQAPNTLVYYTRASALSHTCIYIYTHNYSLSFFLSFLCSVDWGCRIHHWYAIKPN